VLPPEVVALTRGFLAQMELVGNPGLSDRGPNGLSDRVLGWALRDSYWVVTPSGHWHDCARYDPDRGPRKPSLDKANLLLQEALVGYGAVDPELGGRPLARCDDPVQVAAILDRIGSRIYDEAILAIWPQLTRHPAFPAPTHNLIEVQGRGSRFGEYRFQTSQRWPAWFADTDYERLRMWVDGVGFAWTEAEPHKWWIPTDRRNAPTLAIVVPGADFAVTRGYPEPRDCLVMNTHRGRSASVKAARRVLATI
jgi:hypothetical protein